MRPSRRCPRARAGRRDRSGLPWCPRPSRATRGARRSANTLSASMMKLSTTMSSQFGGIVAPLPLDGQVGLVVRLEVAHAGGHQPPDRVFLPAADGAGVWFHPVEAHDRHDVDGEQALRELQRGAAAVVQHLDPLDLHGLQFRQPEVEGGAGRVIDRGRPVDAAAVVGLGAGESSIRMKPSGAMTFGRQAAAWL